MTDPTPKVAPKQGLEFTSAERDHVGAAYDHTARRRLRVSTTAVAWSVLRCLDQGLDTSTDAGQL